MKVAFLTEIRYGGPFPSNHPNARTEIAWMIALKAMHYYIYDYKDVKGYDAVFIIFPKGTVNLNAVGSKLIDTPNTESAIYASDIVDTLKQNNIKVCFIQEGPCWFFNDYTLVDQFNYYNQLGKCDILFAHNHEDTKWYRGLFPYKPVSVIPSLMIEDMIRDIPWVPNNRVMIGGNFARWYGGFQSYLVASDLGSEMWVQSSHASREGEDQIPDLKVLPRVAWIDWIKTLSTFKYGVNMMPTAAAGTFSLNCAYFGIPCIGNKKLDTQSICHPDLSVDPEDVEYARELAIRLKTDESFYKYCSDKAKTKYRQHFDKDVFLKKIYTALE
jgi:hypothetical protein